MEPVCSCTDSAPWPAMVRLAVGGLNRYYLCPQCGAIREEVCDTAGLILGVRWYPSADRLSAAVRERVDRWRRTHRGRQMGLF